MHSFIPHRENSNVGRKIIGIFAVIIFSGILAYFLPGYLNKKSVAKDIPVAVAQQQNQIAQANESVTQQNGTESGSQPVNPQEQQKQDLVSIVIPDSDKLATTIEEAKAPIPIGPRSKDPKVALSESKLYARPQITEGKYIDVSLSHQNMVLFENGQFVDSYLISSGKRGLETPMGTFHIQNKVPRAWSKRYGLYMPNWMALVPSGEFGIHELPEWPGGYKEGANHLGIPVSHGCVRLGVGPAKRVYDWAEVGTTVIIHK